MARPVAITCQRSFAIPAVNLARRILDLSEWPHFEGWGPLPGIRAARFRHQSEAYIGSVIEVENRDGSTHTEEIVAWDEGRALTLRLANFTAPVRHLATHFDEHWIFTTTSDNKTHLVRSLEIHPRNAVSRLLLLPIAWMLHKALKMHLSKM